MKIKKIPTKMKKHIFRLEATISRCLLFIKNTAQLARLARIPTHERKTRKTANGVSMLMYFKFSFKQLGEFLLPGTYPSAHARHVLFNMTSYLLHVIQSQQHCWADPARVRLMLLSSHSELHAEDGTVVLPLVQRISEKLTRSFPLI